MTTDDRTLPLAVGLDTFVVVLFVAIGLREHAQDSAFVNVIKTALPFLIGLAAGWAAAQAWRNPAGLARGLVAWPVTVLVGMVLRNLVFDRGTATVFVVVTTLFFGAGMLGWRAAHAALLRSAVRSRS